MCNANDCFVDLSREKISPVPSFPNINEVDAPVQLEWIKNNEFQFMAADSSIIDNIRQQLQKLCWPNANILFGARPAAF